MQSFPFRPIGAKHSIYITYDQILNAMETVLKSGENIVTGRKYAVMNVRTGETFSPKQILRIIVGKRAFLGGKGPNGANRTFQTFGFPVGNRDKLIKRRNELKKLDAPIPPLEVLLKKLFSQRWKTLGSKVGLKNLRDRRFPGVYILAYSNAKLEGEKVRESDIFYVGMTCEGGLGSRLQQFRNGIKSGGYHSGAMRFHKVWLRGSSYDPRGSKRFYFAYVGIECETSKPWRTTADIGRLTKVPELELAVIARVKSRLHHEPLLNKK